jgi:mono/diheme cytochrome c family protein
MVPNSFRVALLLSVTSAATLSGPRQSQPSRVLIPSLAGRDSYQLYCAPCHGRSGQGDGPAAPSLTVKPADLTRLTQRNEGVFPGERVRATLVGGSQPFPSHGTRDMPVWGPIFTEFETESRAQVRIVSLVVYIESLQQASSGSKDPGARLFRAYCASCHGLSGRGDGPVSGQLRKATPDLTKYTERNGGVFPSEHLRQIIDGTGPAAHGDRQMPVWGDAFRTSRGGLTPEAVKQRIDAIVRYLGAIQARAGE